MTRYQDRVLMDEPVLFLPLNDASGDLVDITGNGFDAVVYGTLTRNSTYKTVDGAGGIAIAAANDGWAISPKGGIPIWPTLDHSFEAWVACVTNTFPAQRYQTFACIPASHVTKPTATTASVTRAITAIGADSSGGSYFKYGSVLNGAVFSSGSAAQRDDTNFANSGTQAIRSSIGLNSGSVRNLALHHVVVRRRLVASTNILIEVFVDGGFHTSSVIGNIPQTYPNPDYGLGIFGCPISPVAVHPHGSTVSNGNPAYQQWVSHVAAYDYALSDAQILAHYQAGTNSAANKRVAGSAFLLGVATAGFPVFVHRRDTGELIGKTVSDGSGAFSCDIGSYAGTVYAVCVDEVSGVNYPAQVFDLITPGL